MGQLLEISNMEFQYQVVYSERNTILLIVERDRSIVVRAPKGTSEIDIKKELEKKKIWLFEKMRNPQKYPQPPIKKEFITGESLLYLGRNYQLEITKDSFEGVKFNSKFYISQTHKNEAADLIRAWYLDRANEKLPLRINGFAENLGVEYKKISVKNLKYSWASCTPKGNLTFNWKIIKAPISVIDYLIVHELTHLIEESHGPEFWNIVAVQIPGYEWARKWLKQYGYRLEIDFNK